MHCSFESLEYLASSTPNRRHFPDTDPNLALPGFLMGNPTNALSHPVVCDRLLYSLGKRDPRFPSTLP